MSRLRATREGAGLSLGQASRLLGVEVVWLSEQETQDPSATPEQFATMAKVYGCSVAWLRGETAELSAENEALLKTIEHTPDRATVREFMEMISTRDPGAPMPSTNERLAAVSRKHTLAEMAARGSTSSPEIDRTVASKRRYVQRQRQTRDHHCHWPGCTTQVPPAMWGCRAHWFRLPKVLRDRIWATYAPGQEANMSPSAEYLQVADDVQRWIREQAKP